MSIFINRRNLRMPGLNTSSLPDLIFTVLFFFMIVTNMRQEQLKVDYRMPQSRQLERLTNKQAMAYIHIGRATSQQHAGATGMVIQLNDRYASVADIDKFVSDERARMKPEDASNMRVVIKADRDTPMGLINDVKQALRNAGVLDIIYSADQEDLR